MIANMGPGKFSKHSEKCFDWNTALLYGTGYTVMGGNSVKIFLPSF